ncbi:MAG: primosomal protein N' [Pseudomonadota bacterium]
MSRLILKVAIDAPLRHLFDYLPLFNAPPPAIGCRVRVPFGRHGRVGLVVAHAAHAEVADAQLRHIHEAIDAEPLLAPPLLDLLQRAADYYHAPPGEVFVGTLPALLRAGRPARLAPDWEWHLADSAPAPDGVSRAPRQALLLRALADGPCSEAELDATLDGWRPSARTLAGKGWIERRERAPGAATATAPQPAPALSGAQQAAVDAVTAASGFHAFLLDGVTGSGKTEVYLAAIEATLAAGRQALVLVPEIGLTPQTEARFRARFGAAVAVLHSGLADGERLAAWLAARDGRAGVLIGTRSAVFAPLARPGLIVVDEEHDSSYKQQDGFRYHARDMAVLRARIDGVPVLLGSATPSLESLANAHSGQYRALHLHERAGSARLPQIDLLDVRHQRMTGLVSPALAAAMRDELAAGRQVMLFLNRRGYAPVLLCHACGWVPKCTRCDAHYTLHRARRVLLCHHCGSERPAPAACGECGSAELLPLGVGTERIEADLAALFPDHAVLRVDRDSTRRRGALDDHLAAARDGRADILIGTQMLAKGHHFPAVTLVGILDADQGLFAADFRATERLAQTIHQVAGRCGRGADAGRVLIQTHQPQHPLWGTLLRGGYGTFARGLLAEREAAGWPPFSHLALLRAEAPGAQEALWFLGETLSLAAELGHAGVELLGPVPAPMPKRAGRYRAQLLLQARRRAPLHALLRHWIPALARLPAARQVRWSLDVDPADTY